MHSNRAAAPGPFMKKLGHLNQSRKGARGGFYFDSNIFVFVYLLRNIFLFKDVCIFTLFEEYISIQR